MKIYTGKVISTTMASTVKVEVTRKWVHPKYKKTVKRTRKYLVHNPSAQVKPGDIVSLKETRPISKRKHFILVTDGKTKT